MRLAFRGTHLLENEFRIGLFQEHDLIEIVIGDKTLFPNWTLSSYQFSNTDDPNFYYPPSVPKHAPKFFRYHFKLNKMGTLILINMPIGLTQERNSNRIVSRSA